MNLLDVLEKEFSMEFIEKSARTFVWEIFKSAQLCASLGGIKMSVFTANKLKEARTKAGFSQEEAAKRMHMSRRNLQYLESNERPVTAEDIVEFAKLYKVDVRELLLKEYAEAGEEQVLCNRYYSLVKLYDQLRDKDKEDIYWVIKQRVEGKI